MIPAMEEKMANWATIVKSPKVFCTREIFAKPRSG